MENLNIKFSLSTNNYNAGLEFMLDKHITVKLIRPIKISIDLDFKYGLQTLDFILANKKDKDSIVEVHNFSIDNMPIGHAFYENSVYHHNFNGNSDEIEDRFYGKMGCNGIVRFKFESPIYPWILANT